MTLSPSSFCRRYRSSYETPSSSSLASLLTLLVRKRYRGTSELVEDTETEVEESKAEGTDSEREESEDESPDSEGLGYRAARRRALELDKETTPSTFEVGQSSRSVQEQHRTKEAPTPRLPTRATWVDPVDGTVYTDIPIFIPPVRLPRLDAFPPILLEGHGWDITELFDRSMAVREEIYSQRFRLGNLERAQEYEDHRLIYDLLLQNAAIQRELQEMRDRVTTLEQEKSHYCSGNQYAVSIKEDTAYLFMHSPKTKTETRSIRCIQEKQCAVFKLYGNKIFWKISNVVPTPRNPQYAVSKTLDTPGSDHEDANEHIEKVLEIVDLFHIPNITIDQVMLRAFPMSLTGAASHWLRNKPSGSTTTWEDPKTKFLSKYCPPARTVKKMKEINNFQQKPNENLYQAWERFKKVLTKYPQHYLTEMREVVLFYNGLDVPTRQTIDSRGVIPSKTPAESKKWLNTLKNSTMEYQGPEKVNEKVYAAQVRCEQCKGPHYTKDCPLKEKGKTLEEAYYNQFGAPFQGGGYRATALGFYQRNNMNPSYQERRQSIEDTMSKFMSELAKIHEENSNLIKEIRASTDAAIRNQGASIKTLDIQICRLNGYYCEEKKGSYGPQFLEAYSYGASHNSIPRKEKDLGSFTLPCFINNVSFDNVIDDLGASVSVMPLSTNLNLRLGELAHTKLTVELADRTVKYPKGIAENVLVGLGKKELFKSVKPASSLIKRVYMLRLRERMELDLEARLMGETLVLNRSLDPFFEDYIELNDLNVPLKLRRDYVDDLMPTMEEGEVIKEFRARTDARCNTPKSGSQRNVEYPRALLQRSIAQDKRTTTKLLENIDAYRDKGMGDVIVGGPFLREVGIKTKRFKGIITLHKSENEVTYQMVRLHPRFKCHTNEQCNKIPPLLKIIKKDEKNGISHAYQKLKGFYKGALNLGPDYI
ncbi:pyruvate dehydrogenase (acetyl-transferring) kinase, mitochondrial [Tanacetum coccineum]